MTANAVVSAVGMLNRPKVPQIEGLESFAGPKFHTARWDHSVDYKGKRVGMIGTGASGMQVGPAIQPFVAKLTIFQRSPHWAMLNPLYFEEVTAAKKWVLENIPFYTKWFRFQLFWSSSDTFHHNLKVDPDWPDQEHSLNAANAEVRKQLEAHIAAEVGHDPELIRKATPDYPPYGKRMLRDNHWYRMLTRPNVDLVDEQIDHVEPEGVVTADGTLHPCDILVLATGFETRPHAVADADRGHAAARHPRSLGRRGPACPPRHHGPRISQLLPDLWAQHQPVARRQRGVPFRMPGALYHAGLRELIETGQAALEVKPEPFWDYQDKVDKAHSQLVWAHPGVTSWYKNAPGRVHAASPWRLVDYRNLTAIFDPSEYEFTPAPGTQHKDAAHEPRLPAQATLDRGDRCFGHPSAIGGVPVDLLQRAGFQKLYPVNPKNETVQGLHAYPEIEAVPEMVDLAIIALSADATLPMLERCHALGITAAMVYASGYAETNESGRAAKQEALVQFARRTGMIVAGPNCMGNANFTDAIFTTFGQSFQPGEPAGDTALLTQSGNMCATVFRMARRAGVTFSHVINTGNEASVDFCDYLDHLAEDPATRSAVCYIEELRDGPKFLAAAAKFRAAGKLLACYKVGASEKGAEATRSHTAALAGDSAAYDAAFARAGVARAGELSGLADLAYLHTLGDRIGGIELRDPVDLRRGRRDPRRCARRSRARDVPTLPRRGAGRSRRADSGAFDGVEPGRSDRQHGQRQRFPVGVHPAGAAPRRYRRRLLLYLPGYFLRPARSTSSKRRRRRAARR